MTAQIINRRIPHVSVPKLMAIVDGIIILFGIGVFGLRNGIYALIVLFVMTKVSGAGGTKPCKTYVYYFE